MLIRAGESRIGARDVLPMWMSLLRRRRPWRQMPLDDISGGMRQVLTELLDGCGELHAATLRASLYRAAQSHGVYRRRQRCIAPILDEEILLIQEALARVLERHGCAAPAISDVLGQLAQPLRSIRRAAHSGHADR